MAVLPQGRPSIQIGQSQPVGSKGDVASIKLEVDDGIPTIELLNKNGFLKPIQVLD